MISKKEALKIAYKDAVLIYKHISDYKANAKLQDDNWFVDYEFKEANMNGGGPHYIIAAKTGEIIKKKYDQ